MKNLLLLTVSALMLNSCGLQEKEIEAADAVCKCFSENLDDELKQSECLEDLGNSEEFGNVSESGMIQALEQNCPEGLEQYQDLMKSVE